MTIHCQPLTRKRRGFPAPRGLLITDFDGTLLRSDRTLGDLDRKALEALAARQVLRIIATGRSMHSFETVGVKNLPVDYVIFSTGAGVVEWPEGRLVRKVDLPGREVRHICGVLRKAGLDLMVLQPIPKTHHFTYLAGDRPCEDFRRRLALYGPYAEKLPDDRCNFGEATQVLVIVPAEEGKRTLAAVREALPEFSVIQTTSPLDGASTWIEIFPNGVSKSATANWLAQQLAVSPGDTLSIGNDYNDLDLLDWAGTACVVANAPAAIRDRYTEVASNDEGGVAEAIHDWCAQRFDGRMA
jgi:Cof subfamily protein (haloacid dehalogenase superfamily)